MSQSKKGSHRRKIRTRKNRNLPILLGLGGILLVGLAFLALGSRPSGSRTSFEVSGSPRLIADKEKVDLGDVKLGKWVDVSFRLTNVGDQPLRFTEKPYIEVVEGC